MNKKILCTFALICTFQCNTSYGASLTPEEECNRFWRGAGVFTGTALAAEGLKIVSSKTSRGIAGTLVVGAVAGIATYYLAWPMARSTAEEPFLKSMAPALRDAKKVKDFIKPIKDSWFLGWFFNMDGLSDAKLDAFLRSNKLDIIADYFKKSTSGYSVIKSGDAEIKVPYTVSIVEAVFGGATGLIGGPKYSNPIDRVQAVLDELQSGNFDNEVVGWEGGRMKILVSNWLANKYRDKNGRKYSKVDHHIPGNELTLTYTIRDYMGSVVAGPITRLSANHSHMKGKHLVLEPSPVDIESRVFSGLGDTVWLSASEHTASLFWKSLESSAAEQFRLRMSLYVAGGVGSIVGLSAIVAYCAS